MCKNTLDSHWFLRVGVAIGLATMTLGKLPQYGSQIQAVILAGTLIYELIGPVITKIALTKAGEIPQSNEVKQKKRNACRKQTTA